MQFLGWKVGEAHWPLPWLPLVHVPVPQLVDALAGAHLPPAAHAPVMQVPEQAPSAVPVALPVQVKPVTHWEVVEHEAPRAPRDAQSFWAALQPFAQGIVAAVEHTPSSLHK